MIKTFTQTDLIRYLYHETTEKERKEIDNALICDSELRALYNELMLHDESIMDEAQHGTILGDSAEYSELFAKN